MRGGTPSGVSVRRGVWPEPRRESAVPGPGKGVSVSPVRRLATVAAVAVALLSAVVLALALTASPAVRLHQLAARRRHRLQSATTRARPPTPPAPACHTGFESYPGHDLLVVPRARARTRPRCPRRARPAARSATSGTRTQKAVHHPQHARHQSAPRLQLRSASAATRRASASSIPAPARITAGRPPGSRRAAPATSPQKHAGKVACTSCHTNAQAFHLFQASSPGFKNCGGCHTKRHAGKRSPTSKCATCHKGTLRPHRRSTPARSPRSTCAAACHTQEAARAARSAGRQELPHLPQRQVPRRAAHARPSRCARSCHSSPCGTPTASRARLCHRRAVHNPRPSAVNL